MSVWSREDIWTLPYQDFVIVLPGTIDNLPQYFENFCLREQRAQSNCQITIDRPPVKNLQQKEMHK